METPDDAPSTASARRRRSGITVEAEVAAKSLAIVAVDAAASQELSSSQSVKRRRVTGKQADSTQASQVANSIETMDDWPESATVSQYVPLEAFWWRRVVCDEFHELLSRYPPAQVAVELFHADYKWGLSGTPPCQTLAQIRKAAGFLGVQLPTAEATDKEEPRKVAQEWLDAFVRRNTAELPPLEEQERIIPIRQTPKERALYLALTEQHSLSQSQGFGISASQGLEIPMEIKALKDAGRSASGLLKLCSHFCASGASDVLTAEDECERQLAIRREQARLAERDVRSMAERAASTVHLVQHFEPYYAITPDASNSPDICKETKASISARLKFLGGNTVGTKAELLPRLFAAAAARGGTAKERALQPAFDAKSAGKASLFPAEEAPAWQQLLSPLEGEEDAGVKLVREAVQAAVAACGSDPPSRCIRLRSHLGMPRWPGVEEPGSDEERELQEANRDWLRVRANSEKLQKVVEAWKADIQRCALRLQALQVEVAEKSLSLRSFQETLHASQMAAQPEDLEREGQGSRFAKYGSKIEMLVKHVKKIQSEDSGCKMICFVQWEDLKRKVSSALQEFGVEHISLQGSVWGRQTALRRFQYELDGPRILLLSLEESASGTNLTAANHVLIVHPMEAESREEAVAFEMQAVGRVRRPGQQRKIHIWRFVTMGTIEQEITEDHQRELWERQRSKILVSQSEEDLAAISDGEAPEEDDEAHGQARDSTQPYLAAERGGSHHHEESSTQCYMPAAQSARKGIQMEDDDAGWLDLNKSQSIPCTQQGAGTSMPSSLSGLSESASMATRGSLDVDATQRYAV